MNAANGSLLAMNPTSYHASSMTQDEPQDFEDVDKQEFQELGSPSNNEENTLDLTDEISKEILLHLRIRLGKAN